MTKKMQKPSSSSSPSDDGLSPFDCEGRARRIFAARKFAKSFFMNHALNDTLNIERTFVTTRSEEARAVGFLGRVIDRPVFGKLFWRKRTGKHAAERQNVEKALLQRDLEMLVSRGTTPCLPFRLFSVTTTVGLFRKTRANRLIDARLRGMRIVDVSEKNASFENACLRLLSRDRREDIERESHLKLLAAARKGELTHDRLDVSHPTLCRAGLVDVVFTEKCADRTLFDYLGESSTSSSCLAEVYLMLVHALSVFARHDISHNDLHSRNVVVRRVPPTVVSFGETRRFVTTVVPFVVDWDMGRSDAVPNPELDDYWHVGLSDRANPLFDLYGLVKTFLYHHQSFVRRRSNTDDEVVATSRDAVRLANAFTSLLEPATSRHGWLLEYEYRYLDDAKRMKTQKCVQQTPYIPHRGSGKVEKRWPASVRELTPRFSAIGDRLHALVERPLGPNDPVPEDAVGGEYRFSDFFDLT